jgi:polyprenyl-phospho-N-acetylgalactosaminyl synthase
MKIIALVLTYNSEKFIDKVLGGIPKDLFDDIVCSDDGSKDSTVQIIEKRNFKLVKSLKNKGYGANLLRGLKVSFDLNATHVVEIHGDGQYDLNFLPEMFEKFKENNDLVLGNRFYKKGRAIQNGMPKYIYYGNHLLTFIGSLGLGLKSQDLFPGFRGYSKKLYDTTHQINFSNGYQLSFEIIATSYFKKLKIAFVPCENNYDGVTAPLSYAILAYIHTAWISLLFRLAKIGIKIGIFK